MNKAGLFIFAITCLVGVVLGLGKGGTFLPNVMHGGMPPPPPFMGGYGYGAYGFGGGRGRGLGGLLFGILGFFLILFILLMLFGLLISSSNTIASTAGSVANNVNSGHGGKQRQIVVVRSDGGLASTNG